METEVKDWPIQPSFLSIRKGINKNENTYSPNRHGLFRADELRGYIADASDDKDIQNVLALFQVVPSDFEDEDNDDRIFNDYFPENDFIKKIVSGRKIVRIFPGELFDNIEPCALFRKCNEENKTKCLESDSQIALLYHKDLEKIHFSDQFELFFTKLSDLVKNYSKISGCSFEVVKCYDGKRLYIKYQCVHSTLEEYFFPVIYSGKVIAVLMQGQRFPKDFNSEKMFAECRQSRDCNLKGEFEESIKCLNKKYEEAHDKEPMSDKRQKAIIKRIERLEARINEAIEANAQKYVTAKFLEISQVFRNDINTINEKKQNALTQFKDKLNLTLNRIFFTFNTEGFIRIYAIRSSIKDDNPNKDEFDLIGDSTNKEYTLKYSLLSFRTMPDKENEKGKDELLNYLEERPAGFDRTKDIFRMDVPFTPRMAYIIWKRYNDWGKKHTEQKRMYDDALKSMYHTLLEPYFILQCIRLEEQMETSMRVTSHEASQVVPAAISAINTWESLEAIDENKDYNEKDYIVKPAYQIVDTSYRLMLLENLFRRSRLIFRNESRQQDEDWYDLHRIIYATETLFQIKAQIHNNQCIRINNPEFPDMNKYKLKTNYSYLSHILFNLVDNAIKYGFRGSRIDINIDKEYEPVLQKTMNKNRIKTIFISVVSYGKLIPEPERKKIFDLYYRSNDYRNIQGMGIGLFLAQKLGNLMNYTVECKYSKQVATDNVVVKFHYTNLKPQFKEDQSLSADTIQLLSQKISENNMNIINTNSDSWKVYGLGNLELQYLICEPVYRNEFRITIPIKEEENKNDDNYNLKQY